jgi:hypothetical protein
MLQAGMVSAGAPGCDHYALTVDMLAELYGSIFHAASLVELLHLGRGFQGELSSDFLPQLLPSHTKVSRWRQDAR